MRLIWQYVQSRWERFLFGCVGASCLYFTFNFLWLGKVTAAFAVFAMAFFSFFYSNLARFKKFKGLGFEAELWEDKQKEAADLIDRLKDIVAAYTREIVMNSVMRGRRGANDNWASRWNLVYELEGRHVELGQQVDLSSLKHEVESVFLFDICSPLESSIRRSIESAKSAANKAESARFGSPITDLNGWNQFHGQLNAIVSVDDQLFERARTENIAQRILALAQDAKRALRENFLIELSFKAGVVERLEAVAVLMDHRPIAITAELISWADDHEAFGD